MSNNDSRYSSELDCAVKRFSNEGMVIHEDNLTVEMLHKKDINVIVSGEMSAGWFYKLKGMGIVVIIIGDRKKNEDLSDIVIDCFGDDQRLYFNSSEYSTCNCNTTQDIQAVFNIITKLEWDSDFFGFNVAYLSCLHLTDNIWKQSLKFIKDKQIRLLEYLCNCHDLQSVRIAESHGFDFVDIRLTFEINLLNVDDFSLCNDGVFIKANEDHIPLLRSIASGIYRDSRYHFDGNFNDSKIIEFYQGWVEKGVRGDYDDECWCILEDDLPCAFSTIKYINDQEASIGIVGVSDTHKGKGCGKKIILSVLKYLKEKGLIKLSVVTQGRNYSAQNLYQSVGFRTESTHLWYHKWL